MIALTRKSDYALVALAHLVRSEDGLSSAREIADIYRMSLPLVMNILKQLTKSGIVESVRGARGGYRLAVSTEGISLKELIVALEGPIRLVQCAEAADPGKLGDCGLMRWCPVKAPAQRVHERLEQFLSEVTLAEIIGQRDPNGAKPGPIVEERIHEPSLSG